MSDKESSYDILSQYFGLTRLEVDQIIEEADVQEFLRIFNILDNRDDLDENATEDERAEFEELVNRGNLLIEQIDANLIPQVQVRLMAAISRGAYDSDRFSREMWGMSGDDSIYDQEGIDYSNETDSDADSDTPIRGMMTSSIEEEEEKEEEEQRESTKQVELTPAERERLERLERERMTEAEEEQRVRAQLEDEVQRGIVSREDNFAMQNLKDARKEFQREFRGINRENLEGEDTQTDNMFLANRSPGSVEDINRQIAGLIVNNPEFLKENPLLEMAEVNQDTIASILNFAYNLEVMGGNPGDRIFKSQ